MIAGSCSCSVCQGEKKSWTWSPRLAKYSYLLLEYPSRIMHSTLYVFKLAVLAVISALICPCVLWDILSKSRK